MDLPSIYPVQVKDLRSGGIHYKIKEWVGMAERYILWPGIYTTREEAIEAITAEKQTGR